MAEILILFVSMKTRMLRYCWLPLLLHAPDSPAAPFRFHDIVVPGASFVTPQDINNDNIVVGTSGTYAFPSSGFLWSTGAPVQTLDVQNINPTFGTEAYSLNDLGEVVGSVFPGCCSGTRSGFLRGPDGSTQVLNNFELLRGINNAGVLAGENGGSGVIGTVAGPSTWFRVPGAEYTIPEDINNAGVVVGYYGTGASTGAFLRSPDGTLNLLAFPGAVTTWASGVNDYNQVVGSYRDSESRFHGFIWEASTGFRSLDHPNSMQNTYLIGINNAGLLVGAHSPSLEVGGLRFRTGFLAIPETEVPEPSSLLLLAGVFLSWPLLHQRARRP